MLLSPYFLPAEKTRELLTKPQLPKFTADLKKNNACAGDAVKDERYMVCYAYVVTIKLNRLSQEMKKKNVCVVSTR